MPVLSDNDIAQYDSQVAQAPQTLSDADIAQHDSQTQPQSMSVGDKVMNVIGQFGKGLYDATPFMKRISQLMGDKISPAESMYKTLPNPQGTMEQIASMAGQTVPQIAMAAPFMKAAGLIPMITDGLLKEGATVLAPPVASTLKSIAQSSITKGAVGLGAYSGTKAAVEGQDVPSAIQEGMKQGLIFGAMTRLGATIMPTKIPLTSIPLPKAQAIGSVIGGALAGSMMDENPDTKLASAMFMGGLSALTPEERFNFNKSVAQHVNWEKHLSETLDIPKPIIRNLTDQGFDAVQYAGQLRQPVTVDGAQQTWAAPQIAENNYQKGIGEARKQASQLFTDAISGMKGNEISTPEVLKVVQGVRQMANESTNPEFKKNISDELDKVMGIRPGVAKQLGGHITDEELQNYMVKSGMTQKVNFETIHNLKMAMGDMVPGKIWDNPNLMNNEQRISKNIYNKLSDFIGQNNPKYREANQSWGKMKRIEGDVSDLNSTKLSQNWFDKKDPALTLDTENQLNRVEQYFTSKGLGQYNSKQLLLNYHTYNDLANPHMGSLRNIFPLRLAAGKGGAVIGGILGLPFGIAGAGIGSSIGMLTAMKFARPEAYLPFLREIKKGGVSGKAESETAVSASHGLELLQQLISR